MAAVATFAYHCELKVIDEKYSKKIEKETTQTFKAPREALEHISHFFSFSNDCDRVVLQAILSSKSCDVFTFKTKENPHLTFQLNILSREGSFPALTIEIESKSRSSAQITVGGAYPHQYTLSGKEITINRKHDLTLFMVCQSNIVQYHEASSKQSFHRTIHVIS